MGQRGFSRKKFVWMFGLGFVLLIFYFSLREPMFSPSYSFVLLDKDGQLLQARIASDGQWRFPYRDSIPYKYEQALLTYEDKHFYYHPGVDLLAMGRAVRQNLGGLKIKSGGSTLTMQLVRLSRGRKERSVFNKLLEVLIALRLECSYSKKDILNLYAGHAPFGGNVVGLQAASWRYFGRGPHQLSWAEAATLAVLPNSPALIHPGRNRKTLLQKRNLLLDRLYAAGVIDEETHHLARLEDIPLEPHALPQHAPHLLTSMQEKKISYAAAQNVLIKTTIDKNIQEQVAQLLMRHHLELSANSINNAAALVMEVESGNVLAYAGNVYRPDRPSYQSQVDVITAPRSPGSTLKPILYEAMLHDGLILPNTLIPDIPTQVAGYMPKNFDLGYDGAVPASRALARSLNIPAIRLLQQYRYERFHFLLKKLGVTTLTKGPDHYGLSLILGGGENSMWELAGVYASLARTLNHFSTYSSQYDPKDIHPPQIVAAEKNKIRIGQLEPASLIDAGSIYSTFEAMQEAMRPGEEMLWQQFSSSQRIAWKTGTSFGFRDGWAIGVTPGYVVAVWVGNASGEGRPGLTGIQTAAPILFDIFRLLPRSPDWFPLPYDAMSQIPVCRQSGYCPHELCEDRDSLWVPRSCMRTSACPYHQLVHLDVTASWRVNSECASPDAMVHKAWFVLPPAMEWYYRSHTANYKPLPPYRSDCSQGGTLAHMEIIYPKKANRIFVPVELDGKSGRCIFEAAHRNRSSPIHWHVDETYVGTTREFHQMALNPSPGKHTLVLIDETGERLEQGFEIMAH